MANSAQTSKGHILIVDDDRRIRDLVSRYLHDHDFIVMTAEDSMQAFSLMQRFEFDALVLDVMMPKETGVEFTERLRASGYQVPVLLLTALGEIEDRISGLESGADDYLVKPFEPKELVLRLQSILRRTQKDQVQKAGYQIGAWYFDPEFDELKDDKDAEVRLTSVEANLLRALAESAGSAVSRDDLAMRCGLDAGERTIDVQVTRLRRKIEENTKMPKYLQTVRGKGYMLRAERV